MALQNEPEALYNFLIQELVCALPFHSQRVLFPVENQLGNDTINVYPWTDTAAGLTKAFDLFRQELRQQKCSLTLGNDWHRLCWTLKIIHKRLPTIDHEKFNEAYRLVKLLFEKCIESSTSMRNHERTYLDVIASCTAHAFELDKRDVVQFLHKELHPWVGPEDFSVQTRLIWVCERLLQWEKTIDALNQRNARLPPVARLPRGEVPIFSLNRREFEVRARGVLQARSRYL
ncbi:hypothetical protein OIO90_004264 [Microbotryomycetes sp. JL221]|nr:hypothetical protein OIO90_004264 [Microbotryomycetes sp. JL221]